ncbi:unnamed protein product [Adineta ricciae]|uniref:Fe2OG dioxygenase domain-containing protein n=1 Tax=Adineta ricciae TaxID=249248 RepID=A0A813ZVC1_ADIRI|nr:unnamed protein product [Adineta ricciae]CAF1198722.1 unnamed protein product [Adineta ricciae]
MQLRTSNQIFMSRQHFLGTTDLSVTTSLLTNYNVPTKIPNRTQLNSIKQQDDLILIELGTLLTHDECDDILSNMNQQTMEDMSEKYDAEIRNNSRLIVIDDRLARTLWRRLKFSNRLTKLIANTKPLGFNVQGQWELSGVNPAMRLNKYNPGQHFSPHKDAQYAPSGDERSLLSLIIYLNDDYEQGQTKFYFPKKAPNSDIKGLTIREEINAYDGLKNGYQCVTIQPKKGHAILFTHNLLHEAVAPKGPNAKRFILRSDVTVKRIDKPLGFAVCAEEEEDYFACLNLFREAQANELKEQGKSIRKINTVETGELYERSLSIRYCYPRLLEQKMISKKINAKQYELPPEMWLNVLKYLHEQDVQNFIFAYPQFQPFKLIWQAQETNRMNTDPNQSKFIPTIHAQYGSQTLFCFSDVNFFNQHADACCRVAAVYAFFLLGHTEDSQTYTVRYDRTTQEVCEVSKQQLLSDIFYNRNCYGSLYRVKQKDESRREPMTDFDHSVDRTYMTNRHQSQFIGQDFLSKLHYKITDISDPDELMEDDYRKFMTEENILGYQRRNALFDYDGKLVDQRLNTDEEDDGWFDPPICAKNHVLGYREHLLDQTKHDSGTSLFRILSAKDHRIDEICACPLNYNRISVVDDLIQIYNHLIFDFNTHQLSVEHLPDKAPTGGYRALLSNCVQFLQNSISSKTPISYYRVNINKLAEVTRGFNHASCQCSFPSVTVDEFAFLDYTYLSHVHLSVAVDSNHVFVLTTYGGIAAL